MGFDDFEGFSWGWIWTGFGACKNVSQNRGVDPETCRTYAKTVRPDSVDPETCKNICQNGTDGFGVDPETCKNVHQNRTAGFGVDPYELQKRTPKPYGWIWSGPGDLQKRTVRMDPVQRFSNPSRVTPSILVFFLESI